MCFLSAVLFISWCVSFLPASRLYLTSIEAAAAAAATSSRQETGGNVRTTCELQTCLTSSSHIYHFNFSKFVCKLRTRTLNYFIFPIFFIFLKIRKIISEFFLRLISEINPKILIFSLPHDSEISVSFQNCLIPQNILSYFVL